MTVDKKINYKDKKLTKAQQKKTKPANQGGGPNYLGKQKTVTVPKKWLSSPDHVVAELAYITPREQKILLDANIYGSLKGKPNKGPNGIISLQGDLGGYDASPGGPNDGSSDGPVGRGPDKNKQRAADIMTGKTNVSSPTGDTFSKGATTTIGPTDKTSFFDSGLGKIIKTIGLGVIAPQLLAGTKLGTLYSGYNKAKTVAEYAKKFGITDKNVATSLTNTVKDNFTGFNTTSKGPKGPPDDRGNGDGGNEQNALMSEYLLLLQKMEQGVLQKEEQARFNSLKSRLGKAYGGIMNVNMNRGQLGGMNG